MHEVFLPKVGIIVYSMSMLSSLCMLFQFQNLSVKLERLEEGTQIRNDVA